MGNFRLCIITGFIMDIGGGVCVCVCVCGCVGVGGGGEGGGGGREEGWGRGRGLGERGRKGGRRRGRSVIPVSCKFSPVLI